MPLTDAPGAVDFDLHGFVRVRVVDASPADLAAVRRQLGLREGAPAGEPDIVCRFVDRLIVHGSIRFLGVDEAAFTDDAYLVLRSKHKSRARVQIPMADLGGPSQIVCERGLPAVPLLMATINLTAVAKRYVPVHACALRYRGRGILVVGWAKGGKTETLLGLMARGGEYIGDEWVYLAPDDAEMFGIPEPIKVWASHLVEMPAYRRRLTSSARLRLSAVRAGAGVTDRGGALARNTPLGGILRRTSYAAAQQAFVHLSPERLFGADRCLMRGPLDLVVLALSTDDASVHVTPTAGDEIARRMTFSGTHERLDLAAHYLRFRYAFPDLRNEIIETLEERQRELLVGALADKPAITLAHPYPAPIERMATEIDRWLA